jgi:hypothetical protein
MTGRGPRGFKRPSASSSASSSASASSAESFTLVDGGTGDVYLTSETFAIAVDGTHPSTIYLPDQTQLYSPETVPIGRAVWVLSVDGGTGISPMIGGSTYDVAGAQTNPITSAATTLYLFLYRGGGDWLQMSWAVT